MAFRSLSRLSSALSAKASALRSFLLDLCYNKRSVVCWVRSNLSIRKLDSHLSISVLLQIVTCLRVLSLRVLPLRVLSLRVLPL